MKYFVDEEDNEVTGLHFRKTGLDLDLDDDYNESEDNDFGFVDDNEEESFYRFVIELQKQSLLSLPITDDVSIHVRKSIVPK